MNTTSRPATPDQVRLFIGLSSLMVLPMVAVVMIYGTVNQTTSDQAPAWRAFVLAVVVGAAVGLVLVSFVPLFGGTVPKLVPVPGVLPFTPVLLLFLVIVVGRLVQQVVPVTTGFIGGGDAVVATVLLIRSLQALRETKTHPR